MKVPCEHGRYEWHGFSVGANATKPEAMEGIDRCPGGRPPTTEELIGELERRGWMVPPLQNDYTKGSEEPPKDPWDYDP